MVSVIFQPLYPGGNSLKCPTNWGTGWFSELIVTSVRPQFCHCMVWNESLVNVSTESLPRPAPLLIRIREVPVSVLNWYNSCREIFLRFLSRYKGEGCILIRPRPLPCPSLCSFWSKLDDMQTEWLRSSFNNQQINMARFHWLKVGKLHPYTGTEALYRPYGP